MNKIKKFFKGTWVWEVFFSTVRYYHYDRFLDSTDYIELSPSGKITFVDRDGYRDPSIYWTKELLDEMVEKGTYVIK